MDSIGTTKVVSRCGPALPARSVGRPAQSPFPTAAPKRNANTEFRPNFPNICVHLNLPEDFDRTKPYEHTENYTVRMDRTKSSEKFTFHSVLK